MLKKYRHNMLTDDQVRWIVKQRIEGRMKNEDIAMVQGISVRRVQQIYAVYRKAGSVPVLKLEGAKWTLLKEKGGLLLERMDNLSHAPATWSI